MQIKDSTGKGMQIEAELIVKSHSSRSAVAVSILMNNESYDSPLTLGLCLSEVNGRLGIRPDSNRASIS